MNRCVFFHSTAFFHIQDGVMMYVRRAKTKKPAQMGKDKKNRPAGRD